MARNDGNLIIENAEVLFLNFSGIEGQYNRKGDRNFCIVLEEELAAQMARDGWNIKTLKPREEGEPGRPYIQVAVGYKSRPPHIVMITSKGRTALGEDEVAILDWIDIKNVDLIIHPSEWSVNGKSGIKAYLKTFFVTMDEDYLVLKYNDVPEIEDGRRALPSREDMIDGEVVEDEQRAITRG